jgi:hypothetical protein
MTTINPTNGYTQTTMNSTDVYNYMKRNARKTSNEMIDCLAEALIASYGDDTNIDKRDLKAICAKYMTDIDFMEMECHVTTSMTVVPFSVAHVD